MKSSFEKMDRPQAKRKSFLEEGIPDYEADIIDDVKVESYALASIVIEEYWNDIQSFFQKSPIEDIQQGENFWNSFYEKYLEKTEEFKKVVLNAKHEEIFKRAIKGEGLTSPEKAILRYYRLTLEMQHSAGFPSMNDAFLLETQIMRMLVENGDPDLVWDINIKSFLLKLMSYSRHQAMFLNRMLWKGEKTRGDDINTRFDWNNFEIDNGVLKIKAEIFEKFLQMLPLYDEKLRERGIDNRVLQCPMLYTKKGTANDLLEFVQAELERHYKASR